MFRMQKFSAAVVLLVLALIVTPPALGQGTLVEVFADDFSTNPNTNGRWTIHRAHPSEPTTEAWWSPVEQNLYLTTSVIDHGVAMFAQHILVANQWEAEFDFRIGDNVQGGADGLVFCFYKNSAAYGTPELGGAIGFTTVSSNRVAGYGVEVDTWDDTPNIPPFFVNDPSDSHLALVQDNCGNHLKWVNRGGLEDGQWHHLAVAFDHGAVAVEFDGARALTATIAAPDQRYTGVGFTAATGGGAWAVHQIDNFVLRVDQTSAVPLPPRGLAATVATQQGVRLRWLDASGNETKFVVERRRGVCGWEFLADTSADAQTYLDRLAPSGEELCYRVSAVGELGSSAPTDPACLATPPAGRQQLLVYVGDPQDPNYDHWVGLTPCSKHFNRGYGTAVIVHGWQPPLIGGDQVNGWMLDLARAISVRLDRQVNVLAWDWLDEANSVLDPARNVNAQADALASSLRVVFSDAPGSYEKPVHMIGHSLGSRLILNTAEILSLQSSVPGVYPPAQLSLLDTPDDRIGLGRLRDQICLLRGREVYLDSYYGCSNVGTHGVNLWVDVPCVAWELCIGAHCHNVVTTWFTDSVTRVNSILMANASLLGCLAERMFGTIGFGSSILLSGLSNPDQNRPRSPNCQDTGTLRFVKLQECSIPFGTEVFGLDNDRECLQVPLPTQTSRQPVVIGSPWFPEPDWDCCASQVDQYSFRLAPMRQTQGGGGIVDDATGVASYRFDLVVESAWDYVSFEYNFEPSPTVSTLAVTISAGGEVYPIYLVSAELAVPGQFFDSGLRDIRGLLGQQAILQFDLRTAEPGPAVVIRNLTFWTEPWNGNRAPIADAGLDQVVATNADGLARVRLDGSASTDPDGDALFYEWVQDGLLVTGSQQTVELHVGQYDVALVVRDPADAVGLDGITITVEVGFVRGDSNADGQVDISDAINTLGYLFSGAGVIPCADAADANDDGVLDISDAISTLLYLFGGGQTVIPPPFPDRGLDTTPDQLMCRED